MNGKEKEKKKKSSPMPKNLNNEVKIEGKDMLKMKIEGKKARRKENSGGHFFTFFLRCEGWGRASSTAAKIAVGQEYPMRMGCSL